VKVPYPKPALHYPQQLQRLKERGLKFHNEDRALHLLQRVSYFRLSGYWYPLLADKPNEIFKDNVYFEDAFSLYTFDRSLRQLIFNELEKIEIAIRAQMIYTLSHNHGPFWCEDATLFDRGSAHVYIMGKLTEYHKKSDVEFIKNFNNKYSDPLPPSWMILELIPFSTLSFIYDHLRKDIRSKRVVSRAFQLDTDTMVSWLHAMVYVRNLCAHHMRLWNKIFFISPRRLTSKYSTIDANWLQNDTAIQNDRVYYFLSIMIYFLRNVHPNNKLIANIKQLLQDYQHVDVAAMGFPSDWEQEPMWRVLGHNL
jgi:abortive infection bacteriophage resistance protein